MKTWTAHSRDTDAAPKLLREGWSWGACLWGPAWLWAHGAFVAGALNLGLAVLVWAAVAATANAAPFWALLILQGCFGEDARRWTLARRGWRVAGIVAARDRDEALLRLLGRGRITPGAS